MSNGSSNEGTMETKEEQIPTFTEYVKSCRQRHPMEEPFNLALQYAQLEQLERIAVAIEKLAERIDSVDTGIAELNGYKVNYK